VTRLVVQIPCFNEAATLPAVLAEIPAGVPGVDEIVVLVVDDGSTDATPAIARARGARLVRHAGNRGLAATFLRGLDEALRLGADVIVNVDGDHQYPPACIPQLVTPILAGEADIVTGDRDAGHVEHFGPGKRLLQRLGSWVVRRLSETDVPDAPTGFRAFSREAALRLNVIGRRTYTLETLIQAGAERFKLRHVRVPTNPPARPSRLHRGSLDYVCQAMWWVLRARIMYRPLALFFGLGALLLVPSLIGIGRFLFYYVSEGGAGHIQSLVIASMLFVAAVLSFALGVLADLIAANRRLQEETLYRVRRLESDLYRAGLLPAASTAPAASADDAPLTPAAAEPPPADDLPGGKDLDPAADD